MAQVNFDAVLQTLQGEPMTLGDKGPPLTLALVCVEALLGAPEDPRASAGYKSRRFKLAKRLCGGGTIDLSAEDIAELKDVVDRNFRPLVVGQALELLDPPALAAVSA